MSAFMTSGVFLNAITSGVPVQSHIATFSSTLGTLNGADPASAFLTNSTFINLVATSASIGNYKCNLRYNWYPTLK